MDPLDAPREELEAVEAGRAFADLSDYRKVRVNGADAQGWLNDLVTCDVVALTPGSAHRSLLLSPTGRILADFGLGCDDEGYLLLQPADQPDHIGLLLSRYVLSSAVDLRDATNELALFAVLGTARELVGRPGLTPSVVGSGVDLVMPVGKTAWRIEDGLVRHDLVEVGAVTLEVRRIHAGTPRMGVDFGQDALPAEVGLDWTIDTAKGCFLGQESVAKVRNLGHPPRVLRHLRANVPVAPGATVVAGGTPVGEVTSVAVDGTGAVALAMVAWASAEGPLRTAEGIRSRCCRLDGLARSGHFESRYRGFADCVPWTPSVRPHPSVMNRVPTVPAAGERSGEGEGHVRIDRFPDVDLSMLPGNPSPPDHWQDRAACFGVDPDVFFPISEEEAGPALTFCGACRIREECLAWALKNGERYGVWGGLTEQQRRRLQRAAVA